jgi:predicted site-specific integrase-resolvase
METLNLRENKKALCIKALNKVSTIKKAADLLGIPERTLYIWIKDFQIKNEFELNNGRINKNYTTEERRGN